MDDHRIWPRLQKAWQRRAARWFGRRPFVLPAGRAIVSFTFDDFPRSALLAGGGILERFNAAGTYFASLGLAGQTTRAGEIFQLPDLPLLMSRGHELGCHTYDHCPAWETAPAAFEASIIRNAETLRRLVPGAEFRTLSYPIDNPRPETKRRSARYFACARGGGQTFNAGCVDLNYLAAFFLEQSRDRPAAIEQVIDANRRAGGWLILATHDVAERPTRFGCTPELFEHVVDHAVKSGAEILPVYRAWERIQSRNGG